MSGKELNIAEAMDFILNGQAKTASAETIATAHVVEAADILRQTGFEEEAKIVLATLKEEPLNKEASDKSVKTEEVLFEITSE